MDPPPSRAHQKSDAVDLLVVMEDSTNMSDASSPAMETGASIAPDTTAREQYISHSETESLIAGLKAYIYENGRRYHAFRAGRYPFPCDESEKDRMDLWHHVHLLLNNHRYHLEPLKPHTKRILDLGTGTGIWAIEMAEQHPEIQFTGVDLAPIQPEVLPQNVTFIIADVEDPWSFTEGFDFIHCRGLGQAVRDWPKLLRQAFKQLNPGGLMTIIDTESSCNSDDNSIPADSALWVFQERFHEALSRIGIPDPCRYLAQYMKSAGFVDVRVVRKKIPWGPWPRNETLKQIGACSLAMLESGFRAFGLALFTRVLGMSEDDANALSDAAYAECRNRNVHAFNYQWHVTGRRPEYNISAMVS
ncbi:TAM domain methyltransferase [Ascodesmis nigricans]|uniref:TAM domain methyltransferase n=1 Tax=Ascodesmis nigricans TaxID=341454 RepID=A0A4S2MLZ4_9PEZI|nr:TAM domain methyltransferase [Ascodesmis nigricans]